MKRLIIMLSAALFMAGCPDEQSSSGPVDVCDKPGQQCRLGGGQLGVCSPTEGGELECASQH